MLSTAKFKDELRKYPRPRSSAIREHLQRWLDHDDADAVWQKIVKKADDLKPDDFIRFVITARARASGLVPSLESHSRWRQYCLEFIAPSIKDVLKSNRPLSEMAEALEDAAFNFRLIDDALSERLSHLPVNAVSRNDRGGSQARRAFYLAVGQFLNEKCGTWMDSEVATLADIALPKPKRARGRRVKISPGRDREPSTTIEEVRAARRPTTANSRRPTTH
jgi:hypothetical protein